MEWKVFTVDVYPQNGGDTFEIDDGAMILDADWRGAYRVQLVVAEPVTTDEEQEDDSDKYICGAITASGNKCQIQVDSPYESCHHHTDVEVKENE